MYLLHTLIADYLSKKVLFTLFALFTIIPCSFADNFLSINCPANYSIQADPCLEGWELTYDSIQWSSNIQLADTVYTPSEGTLLEVGTYPSSIVVTDLGGNISVCNFVITVESTIAFPVCNNLIQVSLETGCEQTVEIEDILEGGSYCYEDFNLVLRNPIGQIMQQGSEIIVDESYLPNHWTLEAIDTSSNYKCWGSLDVTLPTYFEMDCPSDITVFCHEPTDPTYTGNAGVLSCFPPSEYSVYFNDQTSTFNCPDIEDYVITRTWSSENTYGEATSCIQTITAIRFSLEDVVMPPDFDGIDQPKLSCESGQSISEIADVSITGTPLVNGFYPDLITCDFSVTVEDTITNICGASHEIIRRWRIIDWCDTGGVLEHFQKIIIDDYKAPKFEVQDTIWVSSTTDCFNETVIPPAVIQEECSEYKIEIQLPWDTLHQNGGTAFVVFSPNVQQIYYKITDACGNSTTKISHIIIEPQNLIDCPKDVVISCKDYFEGIKDSLNNGNVEILEVFGMPEFSSNCKPELLYSFNLQVDDCGNGIIERTISTTNFENESVCEQIIEVNHESYWGVRFPPHETIECTSEELEFLEPEVFGVECENIKIEYEDQLFTSVPDACYKIARTWRVINECLYDSIIANVTVETPEVVYAGGTFPDCDFDGQGGCDYYTFFDGYSNSTYPEHIPDGIIEFTQQIKVIDNTDPVFVFPTIENQKYYVSPDTCTAYVDLPKPDAEDCSQIEYVYGGSFSVPDNGIYENLGIGHYTAWVKAKDLCGNYSEHQWIDFYVIDSFPPVAICKDTVIVEIGSNFTGFVNADYIAEESYDNCSQHLNYSFSPQLVDHHRIYNCFELGDYSQLVWVKDQYNKQDTCRTLIRVQDVDNSCENAQTYIDGFIFDEYENQSVAQVEISLSDSTGILEQQHTGFTGNFQFFGYPLGNDYSVVPKKDINPLNGVTTFDIVLIRKHILHIQYLDSPYKIIAADANKSGSVTISDAVAIRKLILHIDDKFPNNESWRFVDGMYDFPDPKNPWAEPFPEIAELNQFPGISDCLFFIGMKIGDVNNSANMNQLQNSGDRHFIDDLTFSLPDKEFQQGEIFEVPFVIRNKNIIGYQFTSYLNPDVLEILDIKDGFSQKEHFGLSRMEKGYITTSWDGQVVGRNANAFSFIFIAKEDGFLKDHIELNNDFTKTEAYTSELELWNIKLEFDLKLLSENSFLLFQNEPNPFSQKTNFRFFIPEKSEVDISIFTLNGERIFYVTNFYEKGTHNFDVKKKDLPRSGIYYYQIRTSNQTKTQKMILIK